MPKPSRWALADRRSRNNNDVKTAHNVKEALSFVAERRRTYLRVQAKEISMIIDYVPPEVLERPKSTTVEAEVFYIEPSIARPSVRYGGAATGETAAIFTPQRVRINNAREFRPSLDRQGFALVPHTSAVRDYDNEDELLNVGRAEAAEIVRDATGASNVYVFDHTLRRHAPDAARQPSIRVHNDYTAASARQRVRDFFGDAAASLPFAFINVWRPIKHAAIDRPLAFLDARSVAPGDLVATELVYPDRRGENYSVTANPRHRWSYFPDVTTDEALLIKCADTRDGVAKFTPHTSFDNPLAPPDAPPRESVEFRAIAFFPEKRPIHIGQLR
jgi:hypothetical protein